LHFPLPLLAAGFGFAILASLICKKMKLPFDLILFVSIGNMICVNQFDLLTQLRFIFAVLAKMIGKKMMLLFVLILFVLPTRFGFAILAIWFARRWCILLS
jgi:hypothetical protein